MPNTLAVISIANINDPSGALQTSPGGLIEPDFNAGVADIGDTISFDSTGDASVMVADGTVLGDNPGLALVEDTTINGQTFTVSSGAMVEADYSFVAQDLVTGLYFRITHISINNIYVGAAVSRGFDVSLNEVHGLYEPGTQLVIVDPDPVSNTPEWDAFVVDSSYSIPVGGGLPDTVNPVPYSNDVEIRFDNTVVICFGRGVRLLTAEAGYQTVEDLEFGDVLLTVDGSPRAIRWIGSSLVGADRLKQEPHLAPIRIRAGALGPMTPSRDILVSPQHRVMLRSPIVARMIGEPEYLTPAKHLIGLPGVEVAHDVVEIEYFHVLFDDHEIILAEGVPAESLLLGDQALATLRPEARAEIEALFPEILFAGWDPAPAAAFIGRKRAARMVERHVKNGRPAFDRTAA